MVASSRPPAERRVRRPPRRCSLRRDDGSWAAKAPLRKQCNAPESRRHLTRQRPAVITRYQPAVDTLQGRAQDGDGRLVACPGKAGGEGLQLQLQGAPCALVEWARGLRGQGVGGDSRLTLRWCCRDRRAKSRRPVKSRMPLPSRAHSLTGSLLQRSNHLICTPTSLVQVRSNH